MRRAAGLVALLVTGLLLAAGGTAQAQVDASSEPIDRVLPEREPPRVERAAGEAVPDEYIVTLEPLVSAAAVDRAASDLAAEVRGEVLDTFTAALDGFVVEASEAEAEALLDDPRVAAVQENGRVSAAPTQDTGGVFSGFNIWGIDRIDQEQLPLDESYTYPASAGAGVEAYVVDTGIRPTHEDIVGRAAVGFDASPLGSNTGGLDCDGHGSHVAGTVGGSLVGVAKAVTLTGVRVLDCNGDGTDASVIAGLDYVIADHTSGPAVANLSIGGGPSTALDAAVQATIDDGVAVVVAAGNENTDACLGSPARAVNAITVGATGTTDARASFSNFGSCVDLFAPGVDIISLSITDNVGNPSDVFYAFSSGTSMASPHVAGVVALVLAEHPTATQAEVTSALLEAAPTGLLTGVGTGSPNRLLNVLTPPGTPTGLVATPGSGQVSLSWSAPATVGNTALTSFRVLRDGEQVHETTDAATLAYVDTDVVPGTTYAYRIEAVNWSGPGPSSTAADATVPGPPGRPTGLTATPDDQQVGLTWTAPSSDGGSPVTSYRVYRDGGSVHQTADGSTRSFTDTGLTNGTQHSYVVAAVNAHGEGLPSTPPVLATARTTPGAPTGVTATPGDGEVAVSWTAPASDGGSPIVRYELLRDGSEVAETANGSTLSLTDTGLTNGTGHSYAVRAVNAAGAGAASTPGVPASPRSVPSAPGDLQAVPGDEQVVLSWAQPSDDGGAAITGYRVLREGGEIALVDDDVFTYLDDGLANGQEQEYQVAAVNAAGSGTPSATASATPRTTPGAPAALEAEAGDETVTLTWEAPASDGGAAISTYVVYRDGDPHETVDGSTLSFADEGLTNGETYAYEVAAVNVAGAGPRSEQVSATPVDLAASPTGLQATPSDGEVELSWTAPSDDGGSPITGYRLFRDGVQVPAGVDLEVTTFTDTGLTNGQSHSYRVRAVTAAGVGAPSAPVEVTPRTVPGAPGLSGTAGDGEVALAWTPPSSDGGSAITTYRLYQDEGSEALLETADGSTFAHTVTGLANGTTYDFEVAAVNAAGEGPRSDVLTRTPVAPPAGPSFLDVSPSHPFYDDIEWMAAQQISNGYLPGPTYQPSSPVSRQAMSAFMYRLAGEPVFEAPSTSTFSDVVPGHPFYDEVEWMAEEGITNGTPGSPKPSYLPGNAVSRQAMSAFMRRLAEGPGVGAGIGVP